MLSVTLMGPWCASRGWAVGAGVWLAHGGALVPSKSLPGTEVLLMRCVCCFTLYGEKWCGLVLLLGLRVVLVIAVVACDLKEFSHESGTWPGSSVGSNVILMRQGCGFDPWSGHIQESTNECVYEWNNKSMSLSLSPSPPLSLPPFLPPFLPLSLYKINK